MPSLEVAITVILPLTTLFHFLIVVFAVQSPKVSSVGRSSLSSSSVSSQCLSWAALSEISAWASLTMRWVHGWTLVFLSDLKPNSPCCCFWSVCAADRCTSGHLLHDLPGLCWWRAEPEVEAQAPASHHGLSAAAHGLFYQFRQHGHRGAQALQSPAWTTLGSGWVVRLFLCSDPPPTKNYRHWLKQKCICLQFISFCAFSAFTFCIARWKMLKSLCKWCHLCLLQVFFTMSIWECLQFSAQTPSTSWQASMASSQVKLCVSPAPSSCSTCWSSVVCGLSLTVSFIQPWVCWYEYRCVIIILHSRPFQTECELAGSRNLCILQFPVDQRFLIKYRMLSMSPLTFGLLCIRRLPWRPCILPLLHDTILLHNTGTFLPQLVS